MGLRELKKEQTRELIAETARRLFEERGFDRVTVVEVAREAQVAPATVFNYFATKEDLLFSGLESYGGRLVDAVAARPAGEPAAAAFRRHLLEPGGLLAGLEAGDRDALARLRAVNRLIAGSMTLQAREQRAFSGYADALAALLAEEAGAAPDDVRARVAASALVGVQRALVEEVRRRVLADERIDELPADVRRQAEQAFALLDAGLRDYAPKP